MFNTNLLIYVVIIFTPLFYFFTGRDNAYMRDKGIANDLIPMKPKICLLIDTIIKMSIVAHFIHWDVELSILEVTFRSYIHQDQKGDS